MAGSIAKPNTNAASANPFFGSFALDLCGRCYFKQWLAPLQSATRMPSGANTFFSPGIWVVCSRPLKNDEQAVQHYYLKDDRQAVEHYQWTADAGKLSRTGHFNLARNS